MEPIQPAHLVDCWIIRITRGQLVSGDHEEIRRWRRRTALEKTLRNRPDLLDRATLGNDDKELLAQITGKEN